MSGQPTPPPTDVHAMRPHAPPKGDDSGHPRQTTPSARAEGRSADNRTYTGALAGNMRRHTLTGRRLGASLGSCPPASWKLRTARPPKGLSDPLPGGCPSSLASTTSGGLFARTDRTSKALGHPTPRSESHAPLGSHKSARYVILRPHYGDGDLRRGDLRGRPSRRSSGGRLIALVLRQRPGTHQSETSRQLRPAPPTTTACITLQPAQFRYTSAQGVGPSKLGGVGLTNP
jgi:hypothetical protein